MVKKATRELTVQVELPRQLPRPALKEEVEEELHTPEAGREVHHGRGEADPRVDTKDVHHLTQKNLDQGQEAPITKKERGSQLDAIDHQAVEADPLVYRGEIEVENIVVDAQPSVVGDPRGQKRQRKSDNIVAVEATRRASKQITKEFRTWKRAALQQQPTTNLLLDLFE